MMNPFAWWRARLACAALQLQSLARARRGRWRRPAPGEPFWLDAPEGRVAAEFVLPPKAAGRVPAYVIVHGSHGPLAFYRLLASRLTERGIGALLIALPGFGRSPSPQAPYHVDQFTGRGAVKAALAFLRAHRAIDGARIGLLGHSFGGSVALAAAVDEGSLAAVVALGPTRRVEERTLGPGAKESAMWRARFAISRRLKGTVPMDLVAGVSRAVCLEYHLDAWRENAHPPVHLVDGAKEGSKDLCFLRMMAGKISSPVSYRTVPGADHYLNSGSFGKWVFEDPEAMATFADWAAGGLNGCG